MDTSSSIDNRAMPANESQLQRRISPFNAWFMQLDEEQRSLLQTGRLRLLLLRSDEHTSELQSR